MSTPYRTPTDDEPIVLGHDYAADVRTARDPKRVAKGIAIWLGAKIAVAGILSLLFNGSVVGWLTMSGVILVFYGMVVVPIAIMIQRGQDEKMQVNDLLDDLDRRDRR